MSSNQHQAKRYLGIDYGAKRVGVAVGDTDTGFARGLTTLTNVPSLLDDLRRLAKENDIDGYILGLPRNLEGGDTSQTAVVRKFAQALEKLGLPVILQDEALTTEQAAANLGPRLVVKNTGQLDQEAARIILEDYLREHRTGRHE